MRYRHVVVAAAGLVLVAACSSSHGGNSASTTSGGKSSGPAETAKIGRFTFPTGAATGSIIKIGLVNSNNQIPELAKAAQAAVDYVNANFDGISGHRVELVTCDEMANPVAASTCSPTFVQQKVAAVIGYPLVWTAIGGLKQLQAADIPFVGVGQGIAESAPNSYPIFGTDIPLLDIVSQFKADNIKTVNVLSVNFPASISTVSAILKPVWAKQGVTIGKSVFYTSGAADVTTPATQVIAGHPDAVYVINGPQDVVRTIQAIRQAGYTGRIFAGYSVETPSLFPAASKILTGVVNSTGQVLYFNDTSNPEVALMHKVLGGSIPVDSYSQSAVAQVLTLVDMGNKIGGELTGMKLLAYLKNIRNQKVFMGYQMDISDILPNVLALSHVTNTFDRFVTYNGTAFKYIGGWMSVSGIETPGAGAGS